MTPRTLETRELQVPVDLGPVYIGIAEFAYEPLFDGGDTTWVAYDNWGQPIGAGRLNIALPVIDGAQVFPLKIVYTKGVGWELVALVVRTATYAPN